MSKNLLSRLTKFRFCLLLLTGLGLSSPGKAQTVSASEKQAADLLEKAMGTVGSEDNNMALYFEGIAYGIAQPKQIFTLPAYQVHRGGFLLHDGKKFEIQLGVMKALCDGQVMVMVDEQGKTMVVDSLRDHVPGFEGEEMPDVQKLVEDNFGKGELRYEGKEMVQGKSCHRIKAMLPEEANTHVYYWIEVASGKLLLMAEYQEGAYDTYWINRIGRAPKNHVYRVNLPKKTLESFHGYEVFDYRFTARDLEPRK